jgi:sigma-54 dependent transcriptional regulator, acetoin dehydrogenase operon transcriptional activator AcoR
MNNRKRILVVDDEEQNLELLEAFLEFFGYDSERASDGLEALSKLNANIDLVLLDVMMPCMDGFEVVRRIRHDPVCSDLPVIMVTSLLGKEDRLRAVEAGANDFITKPVDKVELRVRMASLLRMKEAQDQIKRHKEELEATVRQQTEDLRESEEKFRTLFHGSLDAILIVNRESRITDANQAFLDLFAFSREEALRLNPRELFVDPADFAKLSEELLATGFVRDREWTMRTRFGAEKDCVLSASLRRSPDGTVLGFQSLIHDVTVRKRVERALRESEEQYRVLVENSHEGMVVEQEGVTKFLNPKTVEIFGRSHEEILAGQLSACIHPGHQQAVIDRQQAASAGESSMPARWVQVARSSGNPQWVELKSIPIRWHTRPAILTFISDVTSRKSAEDSLRESESRFRAIVEAAPDIIFMKDRDLKYTHGNPAMLKAMDLELDELVGKTDDDLVSQATARGVRNLELRVVAGQSMESEHTVSLPHGVSTWNCVRVPLRSDSGEVIGICGIGRDVTERAPKTPQRVLRPERYVSEAMKEALQEAAVAAQADSVVLFRGESDSGKSHLAKDVHIRSRRSGGPFLSINCATLSGEHAASELFGQASDACGVVPCRKRGMLELAEGGTLLLREIGDLSLDIQGRLVTFLDTGTIFPVGAKNSIGVDTRLLAASSRDLEKATEQGVFRRDLLYRLEVFCIRMPPMRERMQDLPLLVEELLDELREDMGLRVAPKVTPAAMEVLSNYRWPGNFRELRNVLERAVILSDKTELKPHELRLMGMGKA